jgi:hypothetical protein
MAHRDFERQNLTTACRPLIRLDHGFVFAVKFDGGISELIELFSQKQAQAASDPCDAPLSSIYREILSEVTYSFLT